jgi:hypothetical protein
MTNAIVNNKTLINGDWVGADSGAVFPVFSECVVGY